MSIFLRGSSLYLKVRIDGRQVLRSLETLDKIEAMERAGAILQQLRNVPDTSSDTTPDTMSPTKPPRPSKRCSLEQAYTRAITKIEQAVTRGHHRPSYELDLKGLWSRHLSRFGTRHVDASLNAAVIAYLDSQSLSVARRRKVHTLFRTLAGASGMSVQAHRFTSATPPRQKRPLTPEQLLSVKKQCLEYPHPMARLIYLAAVTGARIGEITALEPDDVGQDDIRISKTRCRRTGTVVSAKTRNAVRLIPVSPDVLALVRPAIGTCKRDWFPIWRVVREKAGIGKIGIHVLRHTWATHALGKGITPKAVSLALGHFSVAFTEAQYASFLTTDAFKDELRTFNR
jgi:integrase